MNLIMASEPFASGYVRLSLSSRGMAVAQQLAAGRRAEQL